MISAVAALIALVAAFVSYVCRPRATVLLPSLELERKLKVGNYAGALIAMTAIVVALLARGM